MIKIIRETSDKIKNERDLASIMLHVASETGELAEEVRKIHDPSFYKKVGEDGILGEGCDVIITVVDLLIKAGYDEAMIIDRIKQKCQKWENKANGGAKK